MTLIKGKAQEELKITDITTYIGQKKMKKLLKFLKNLILACKDILYGDYSHSKNRYLGMLLTKVYTIYSVSSYADLPSGSTRI